MVTKVVPRRESTTNRSMGINIAHWSSLSLQSTSSETPDAQPGFWLEEMDTLELSEV